MFSWPFNVAEAGIKAAPEAVFIFYVSLLAAHLIATIRMRLFKFKITENMALFSVEKNENHQEFLRVVRLMLDKAVTRLAVEDAWLDKSMVEVSNKHAPNLFLDRVSGKKEIALTLSDTLTSDESLDIVYIYDTDFSPPYVLAMLARHKSAGKLIPATKSNATINGWCVPDGGIQEGLGWLYLQIYDYLIRVEEAGKEESKKREKLKQIEEGGKLTQAEVGGLLKSVGIQMHPGEDQ